MGREEVEGEERGSPNAELMQQKGFNLCIVLVMGYSSRIDPKLFKKSIQQTLLKHPRFSSILMKDKAGKCWWKRGSSVEMEKHVRVVSESSMTDGDAFVEEFASDVSKIPLDMRKPLWEMYILNVKTSNAEATVVLKIHHSMGDGISLMALFQACSSNPNVPINISSSSSRVHQQRYLWSKFRVASNTCVDLAMMLATVLFFKDSESPIKPKGGLVLPYKRFVHRIIDLNHIKLIKTAMNATINDVMLGLTQAGLNRYLNARYEKDGLPRKRKLRIRSTLVFNLRASPTIEDLDWKEMMGGNWGNKISVGLVPLRIIIHNKDDDPLSYIRSAKLNMDRKKLSRGHKYGFHAITLAKLLFGTKAAAAITKALHKNTTLTISNIMGPSQEINLFGHPLSYMAPSVNGLPQSLIVHYQTYAHKLVISIGADHKLIPDPHQLCDHILNSLQDVKQALILNALLPQFD